MAAHAYKQSVNELEQGIGRELVRVSATLTLTGASNKFKTPIALGFTLSNDYHGATGQDERVLPRHQRAHQQTEQEGLSQPSI